MPELPEVETVRRGVHEVFAGRRIKSLEATGVRTTRRHADVAALIGRSEGQVVESVGRRGKYLLLELRSGDVVVVHLGMSGQLLRSDAQDPPVRHTHVVWWFADGLQLRFVDPRTFGEVFVTRPGADGALPELAHLGVDALLDLTGWRDLAAVVGGRRGRLKPLLMDQRVVAGIGNMYADEILFAAGLSGERAADTLAPADVRRLHRAITSTLTDAIAHRGSSLSDAQYRDIHGAVGDYQRHHRVYAREGQACVRCAATIVRSVRGGRSSFTCPRCQH